MRILFDFVLPDGGLSISLHIFWQVIHYAGIGVWITCLIGSFPSHKTTKAITWELWRRSDFRWYAKWDYPMIERMQQRHGWYHSHRNTFVPITKRCQIGLSNDDAYWREWIAAEWGPLPAIETRFAYLFLRTDIVNDKNLFYHHDKYRPVCSCNRHNIVDMPNEGGKLIKASHTDIITVRILNISVIFIIIRNWNAFVTFILLTRVQRPCKARWYGLFDSTCLRIRSLHIMNTFFLFFLVCFLYGIHLTIPVNTQCRDFRVGKHSSCPLWNIAPQMDHKVVFNVKHINPVAIT